MTLEDAIYDRLAAITAVTDLVGSRIYRHRRPQGSALPAISFGRVSTQPVNHAGGTTDTTEARIQIDCWSDDQSECRDLADAVRGDSTANGLNGWTRTGGGDPVISMVHLVTDIDLHENPTGGQDAIIWRINQDYLIWYTE